MIDMDNAQPREKAPGCRTVDFGANVEAWRACHTCPLMSSSRSVLAGPRPAQLLNLRIRSTKIMKYLMPRDLLQLARTTKGFRSFLISRSSSGLWKVARENVKGLPCCPSHLSEPAWASLAFETNCNVSGMLESIRTC